jgi:hypothetical protein
VVVARFRQAEDCTVPGIDEAAGQLDAVGLPVVAEAKARDHHVGTDDLLEFGRLFGRCGLADDLDLDDRLGQQPADARSHQGLLVNH